MQFLGHDDTVIASATFQARLKLSSLQPEQVQTLFGKVGQALPRETFAAISPLRVDNLDAVETTGAQPIVKAFAEGRAHLCSGAAGHAEIDARDGRFMMPQPLGYLLAQQWARSGLLALHASVVQINGRGILALGRRGAGKSVLSASVLAANGAVVSDDWVLVGQDLSGKLHGERLRQYLQLRNSSAGNGLRDQLNPHTRFQAHTRAKFAYCIDDADARTPVAVPITELWLLRRPSDARRIETTQSNRSQATFFASLLDASIADFVGNQFPHERLALLKTIHAILATARCVVVETGLELASDPLKAWSRVQ